MHKIPNFANLSPPPRTLFSLVMLATEIELIIDSGSPKTCHLIKIAFPTIFLFLIFSQSAPQVDIQCLFLVPVPCRLFPRELKSNSQTSFIYRHLQITFLQWVLSKEGFFAHFTATGVSVRDAQNQQWVSERYCDSLQVRSQTAKGCF